MKKNKNKVCFITAVNDEVKYEECKFYINNLEIPEGIEIESISIRKAKSITSAYNSAMNRTDAKYKVYIHQDTFIINKRFIYEILDLFENKKIAMIGVAGGRGIDSSGIWSKCSKVITRVYDTGDPGYIHLLSYGDIDGKYEKVDIIDGLIMITQYDVKWREDIFKGWHFYDASQSREFINRGYEIIVPRQDNIWCIHDCGKVNMNMYEENRKIFVREYIKENI